jgi:hypothetical protein
VIELLIQVVLIGLAAAQITMLLVDERGPFAILRRFRLFMGVRYNELPEKASQLIGIDNLEDNEPYALGEVGKIFLCSRCTGTWVGGLLFAAVFFDVLSFDFIAALAAMTICIWVATH